MEPRKDVKIECLGTIKDATPRDDEENQKGIEAQFKIKANFNIQVVNFIEKSIYGSRLGRIFS